MNSAPGRRRVPIVVGMTITFDFTVDVPTRAEEQALACAIEAGLLAGALRRSREAPASGFGEGARGRGPAPIGSGRGQVGRGRAGRVSPTDAELDALVADGERAWRRMICGNLRLVSQVVRRYARRADLDSDELFQEGVLGLIEALRRFDHTRGAAFATFALPWIRMQVMNAVVTKCGLLGVPVSRAREQRQVRATRYRLATALGREASAEELAGELGRPVAWVERALADAPPVSLQALRASGVEPEQPVAEDWRHLPQMLTVLGREEREVIVRRFGVGHPEMSYTEVADALGVSTSTVRRREKAGLGRLRDHVLRDELACVG